MTDFRTTGNPRTLRAHQELQMRGVQRAQSQAASPIVDRRSLHLATVRSVDKDGNILIDRFYDDDQGKGQNFNTLNHTSPRPNEVVVYGYVDDTPFVLGKLPNQNSVWNVPESHAQDTYEMEDFDFSSTNDMGKFTWTGTVASSGTVVPGPGSANTPGVIILNTGTIVGSYAATFPKGTSGLYLDSLSQVGFGLYGSNVGSLCQIFVGLVDNGTTLTNYLAFTQMNVSTDTDTYWNLVSKNGATSRSANTGVPYIDGHYYRMLLRKIAPGLWFGSVFDATSGAFGSVTVSPTLSGTGVQLFPYMRNYMLTASTLRTASLDYCWWSKKGLVR